MSKIWIIAGAVLMAAGLACWQIGLDASLHALLRLPSASGWRSPILDLTRLGGLLVMAPVGLLAVILLVARRARQRALWLFATIASGRIAVELLKLLVTRPRPPQADRLDLVSSWSFPSSHSAGTMLTGLALALALTSGSRWAISAAILFSVLIGWSRLALGVHWPGDVLAGWGFAVLWIGIARHYLPRGARA